MANAIWDGIITYVTWTASTTSTTFNVPRAVGAVSVILPDFTTDTTCVVQGLDPLDKTTWRSLYTYDPGDGTMTLVTLNENVYLVIPASTFGVGTFRFLNANAQTGTATILFDRLY